MVRAGRRTEAAPFEPGDEELLEAARLAGEAAYAPYSRFRVGAAARTSAGDVVPGCNVENASYGLTICAERVALGTARALRARVVALAVSCLDARPDLGSAGRMPCGACRQVMIELMPPDAPVLVDGVGRFRVADLLPDAFGIGPGP